MNNTEQTFEEARFLSSDLTPREMIHQLIDLSFDLKEKGHDFFVQLSPHVKHVSCQLSIGGWHNPSKESYNFADLYYDQESSKQQFEKLIKRVKELTC